MGSKVDRSSEKGRMFGHLTFNGVSKSGKRDILWKSTCVCGREVWAAWCEYVGNPKRKGKTSCGCLRSGVTPERAAKNRCIRIYKRNARNRNLVFKLTFNDFINLVSKNCYYCNAEPANIAKSKNAVFTYNGIDRVDNSVGYIKENCVTCCNVCNRMKNNLTQEEFYTLVTNIILKGDSKENYD